MAFRPPEPTAESPHHLLERRLLRMRRGHRAVAPRRRRAERPRDAPPPEGGAPGAPQADGSAGARPRPARRRGPPDPQRDGGPQPAWPRGPWGAPPAWTHPGPDRVVRGPHPRLVPLRVGVNLTPIAVKETISLERLAGRTLAVDASIELYQFLSIMRLPDGSPLSDGRGHVTSHLNGILFRSTRLISEHGARLLYVFDGRPPALKWAEIEKRKAAKVKAEREYAEAVARGDRATAWSKVVMTTRLTREMKEDAPGLLAGVAIPWVE